MGESSDDSQTIAQLLQSCTCNQPLIAICSDKNHVLHQTREYDKLLCYFAKHRYFPSPLTINNHVKKYSASLKTSCLLSRACLLTRIANYLSPIIIYLLRERSFSDLHRVTSRFLYETKIQMDWNIVVVHFTRIRIFYDIQ